MSCAAWEPCFHERRREAARLTAEEGRLRQQQLAHTAQIRAEKQSREALALEQKDAELKRRAARRAKQALFFAKHSARFQEAKSASWIKPTSTTSVGAAAVTVPSNDGYCLVLLFYS